MPNSITKYNVLCFLFWIGCCVQKLRTQHYKPGLVVSSNLGRCRQLYTAALWPGAVCLAVEGPLCQLHVLEHFRYSHSTGICHPCGFQVCKQTSLCFPNLLRDNEVVAVRHSDIPFFIIVKVLWVLWSKKVETRIKSTVFSTKNVLPLVHTVARFSHSTLCQTCTYISWVIISIWLYRTIHL